MNVSRRDGDDKSREQTGEVLGEKPTHVDVERSPISSEELARTTEILESLIQDRGQLLALNHEELQRFLKAAGQVAHPGRAAKRQLVKAVRAKRRSAQKADRERDEQLLAKTGIRQLREKNAIRLLGAAPPDPFDETFPQDVDKVNEHFVAELDSPRNCYICKKDYLRLHFFYDSMCPDCAEFNWSKRNQSADLSNRVSLVTGGRVKIGFEAALKLLRAGSQVVVTTRFPKDAAQRFLAQKDSREWYDRLEVYGLDMRHTPSVESLAQHLERTLPRLDYVLNNACQTVRRPPGFYEHLMLQEKEPVESLPAEVRKVLSSNQELARQDFQISASGEASAGARSLVDSTASQLVGLSQSAELTQLALLKEDAQGRGLFPEGQLDEDLQQVDLREKNSWRLKLDEVATVELLEVHLVNAVAPYILNARLRPLMKRTSAEDKHIVNVSAMEGIFYRAFKRDTHPHTNMAKAALNMMTRTSAADYIQDGIYMNSVDTGWITDEDPIEITERKRAERGFSTPLDTIDAAARICAPVFDGVLLGEFVWGKFLKDYQVSNW